MVAKVTVRVDGLKELDARLGELKKSTAAGVLRRVLLKAGQPMADTASRLAPDDPATGAPDLHTSIKVGTKIKNEVGKKAFSQVLSAGGTRSEARAALIDARRAAGGGSFAQAYVGPVSTTKKNAIKAIVQEFGSVKQAPQPYMRPAWEAEKDGAVDIIKRELGGEIDRTVRRAAIRAAKKAAK